MKLSTLCYCICNGSVLLAMKKRGFGEGKWNGFGGKVGENESTKAAAARELREESNLSVAEGALEQVALLRFYFDRDQIFECHVFLARSWEGEPEETEEMSPQWFPAWQLPFDEMWVADKKWLPLVLAGKKLEADIYFNADGSELMEISFQERSFV